MEQTLDIQEKWTNYLGYIELTCSMIFLACAVVISKFLVSFFPVFLLLGLRFFIGTLIFVIIIFFTKPIKFIDEFKNLPWNHHCFLFAQAICSALFNIFMLYGLRLSTATAGALITSTTPAFTTLLSFLILREKSTPLKFLAVVFAIMGVIILNFHDEISNIHGDFLGNFLLHWQLFQGQCYHFYKEISQYRFPFSNGFCNNLNSISYIFSYGFIEYEAFFISSN